MGETMATFVVVTVIALVAMGVVAVLEELYRWWWRRNGRR